MSSQGGMVIVKSETKYLDEEQAMAFHRTVAQLLFLCIRARWDIQTAVAFITTKVKKPNEDDWRKVKRMLQYLKGTKSLRLRLSIDGLQCTKWLVDASHGVHWDCKGHTGAAMTLLLSLTSISEMLRFLLKLSSMA